MKSTTTSTRTTFSRAKASAAAAAAVVVLCGGLTACNKDGGNPSAADASVGPAVSITAGGDSAAPESAGPDDENTDGDGTSAAGTEAGDTATDNPAGDDPAADDTAAGTAADDTAAGKPGRNTLPAEFPLPDGVTVSDPVMATVTITLPSGMDQPTAYQFWLAQLPKSGYKIISTNDTDGTAIIVFSGHDWGTSTLWVIDGPATLEMGGK